MAHKLTIACVKHGPLYGPDYVNILFDMVARNLGDDVNYTFACFTDEDRGFNPLIDVRALPGDLTGWWNKLALFRAETFEPGERIVYFDLDTLIVGKLDDIVSYRGPFAILRDFYRPDGWQSAVMSWEAGTLDYVWDRWVGLGMPLMAGGDQEWIERAVPKADLWQDLFPGKFLSYKVDATASAVQSASIVCFHGQPKAHNCNAQWVKEVWKIGGSLRREIVPANVDSTIPVQCNVLDEQILANVRTSSLLPLPWLVVEKERPGKCLIVGGGPSVKSYLPAIKRAQEQGAEIFALNGALGMLSEHGITPDHFVLLDARPENIRFIMRGKAKHYLLASQCDPSVFVAARALNVTLWHPNYPEIVPLLGDRQAALISGGTTVGLQAMSIAYCMGYREIHLYGFDSSYSEGMGHAFPQPENDADPINKYEVGGKIFHATAWMARQAIEFQTAVLQLAEGGCEVSVHGNGLLPEIARLMTVSQIPLAKAS
jgi:uncharacterized Rossmann fold enzyme